MAKPHRDMTRRYERRPAAVPRAASAKLGLVLLVALWLLVPHVRRRRLLAVGPRLRGHRRDRRDRPQPAHRLHRPGLARPRVLPRRRRLRRRAGRRRAGAAAAALAPRRGAARRRWSARSSGRSRCACAATTWRSSRSASCSSASTSSATARRHRRQRRHVGRRARSTLGVVDFSDARRRRQRLQPQPGLLLADLGARRARRAAGQEHRAHAARAARCRRSATATSPPRSSASSLARYKVGAFALSSALAALGGALYGSYQQFVSPERVEPVPVDPVHRDHHRRRGRHDLRLDPRRAVPRRPARRSSSEYSDSIPVVADDAPAATGSSASSRSTRRSSAC